MITICIILFLAVATLWFFANEYPTLFGMYVPVCALKRVKFKILVAVCILGSMIFAVNGDVAASLFLHYDGVSPDAQSIFIILLSALITLLLLKVFSINGSAVYALLGAMEAFLIASDRDVSSLVFLSVLAAPAVAFLFSSALRLIFRMTLDRCSIHLITLSFYMRFAAIAGIALAACAVGINWGGFLLAGCMFAGGSSGSLLLVILITAFVLAGLSSVMRHESDASAGLFGDFSIYSVLSVGFAVAFTMLFFSFDSTTSLIGLKAMPVSVGSLVFAAIAGAESVYDNHMVDRNEYAKEGMALVLAPLCSLLIAFAIFYVAGRNDENIVDFTVMAAAVMVVLSLFFSGYVRRQRTQKEAVDRLVYSQQQQIYEHSRALNDMELKVVISENQALHNSVEMKRQEVMNVALSIVEQKEYLESLNRIVRKLSKSKDEDERNMLISELSASLKQRLSYDRDVDSQYFYAQAEYLHEDFNAKLSENFPTLTQQEKRLATLLRLGFSSKYIATLMNITPKSVEISRYRLRQKLGLSKGDNLVNFIKSI